MLGSPIAHSRSPALHRAAYAALGLPWSYDAVELRPDGLAGWLDGLGPEWAGLSLTMPLKQTVLPLVDELSPLAAATGAANTVLLQGGRRLGDNTDVAGLLEALRDAGCTAAGRSVVLGGGATAASALAALARLGDDRPWVLVRDPARTAALAAAAARLGVRPRIGRLEDLAARLDEDPDVVVSTLPAGAADALPAARSASPVLLDVVYAPWPTALAQTWAGPVVGGAAMLLHQAAAQVQLMTGRPAPVEAMRAALG